MMWWNHGAWGAGDWTLMVLTMLLFWGLLAAAIIWLVRSSRPSNPVAPSSTSTHAADQLLAERFARGEIDSEEYTRRQAVLHPAGSGSTREGR